MFRSPSPATEARNVSLHLFDYMSAYGRTLRLSSSAGWGLGSEALASWYTNRCMYFLWCDVFCHHARLYAEMFSKKCTQRNSRSLRLAKSLLIITGRLVLLNIIFPLCRLFALRPHNTKHRFFMQHVLYNKLCLGRSCRFTQLFFDLLLELFLDYLVARRKQSTK